MDPLRLSDWSGGRNGADSPFSLADDQVVEAMNVECFGDARLGKKRAGASSLTLNGFAASKVDFLSRHVPSDETSAEFWAVDTAATTTAKRLAAGTTWASVTLYDAIQDSHVHQAAVSYNSKWFHAYNSAQNRMHCYDGTSHRRTSQAPASAAPTGVLAAGAITDSRKYKSTLIAKSGSTVLRRSELSSVSSVYSPAAQQVTASQGSLPVEGETHWELWGSSVTNNYTTYHYIGEAAVGVGIVDNNAVLTGYAPPTVGMNLALPSAKYVVADDGRVVMAGCWETSATTSYQPAVSNKRVWWTAVPGAVDINDKPSTSYDERIVITTQIRSYLDVDEDITGLAIPVNGVVYVFSYRSIWRLTATGDETKPYQKRTVTRSVGCIRSKSIVMAEDENGRPAIYFMSSRGPYRITVGGGLEYCGWDIRDIWDTVNLEATIGPHGVYHSDKRQVWYWLPVSSSNVPNKRVRFDTRKGVSTASKGVIKGWFVDSGVSATARASVMFASTPGASMSRDLKPYIALDDATPIILKCDTGTTDNGTAFQSYLLSRPYAPWDRGSKGRVTEPYIVAKAQTGKSVQGTIIPGMDSGLGISDDVDLSPVATESYVERKFESIDMADINYFQVQVGDVAAMDTSWTLDELVVPWTGSGTISPYSQPVS